MRMMDRQLCRVFIVVCFTVVLAAGATPWWRMAGYDAGMTYHTPVTSVTSGPVAGGQFSVQKQMINSPVNQYYSVSGSGVIYTTSIIPTNGYYGNLYLTGVNPYKDSVMWNVTVSTNISIEKQHLVQISPSGKTVFVACDELGYTVVKPFTIESDFNPPTPMSPQMTFNTQASLKQFNLISLSDRTLMLYYIDVSDATGNSQLPSDTSSNYLWVFQNGTGSIKFYTDGRGGFAAYPATNYDESFSFVYWNSVRNETDVTPGFVLSKYTCAGPHTPISLVWRIDTPNINGGYYSFMPPLLVDSMSNVYTILSPVSNDTHCLTKVNSNGSIEWYALCGGQEALQLDYFSIDESRQRFVFLSASDDNSGSNMLPTLRSINTTNGTVMWSHLLGNDTYFLQLFTDDAGNILTGGRNLYGFEDKTDSLWLFNPEGVVLYHEEMVSCPMIMAIFDELVLYLNVSASLNESSVGLLDFILGSPSPSMNPSLSTSKGPQPPDHHHDDNTGEKVGIAFGVIGGVLVLVLIIAGAVYYFKRVKGRDRSTYEQL